MTTLHTCLIRFCKGFINLTALKCVTVRLDTAEGYTDLRLLVYLQLSR
jgi:hypothetical protein